MQGLLGTYCLGNIASKTAPGAEALGEYSGGPQLQALWGVTEEEGGDIHRSPITPMWQLQPSLGRPHSVLARPAHSRALYFSSPLGLCPATLLRIPFPHLLASPTYLSLSSSSKLPLTGCPVWASATRKGSHSLLGSVLLTCYTDFKSLFLYPSPH